MATNAAQPIMEDDASAWPSRYYGRTKHIDLEKIYQDIVSQSQQQEDEEEQTAPDTSSSSRRKVSFSNDAPIIHEYEPEYDEHDNDSIGYGHDAPPRYFPTVFVANTPEFDRDMEATTVIYRKKKKTSVRRLDLRPVQNPAYRKLPPRLVSDDDDAASVSSAEPITPEATTRPPMPEHSWSTSSVCTPASPASSPKPPRRISINRIRPGAWIPKSIQNIL